MKKFLLAAVTSAIAVGWTGMAAAAVNLDTGAGSQAYANERVVNTVTQIAGIETTNALGFGVSGGQTRFVRYDLANATFAANVSNGALVLAPAASNTVVSQGGGAGTSFVIFQVTAAAAGNPQNSPADFNLGNIVVADKSGPANVTYRLYESAADAAAGGATGLLATASAAVATFPSGLTFSTVTNSTQAEVSKLYMEFNNGLTTTLAKIGTVTFAPNTSVRNPATGNLLVAADMPLFTAAGTKLVLTGADLSAAALSGLYLATGPNCAAPSLAGTNRTATTVDFVVDANAVSARDLCFQATGSTPIVAQGFTVGATVVPAAGSTTANAADIAAGTFTRNGTILKAAFSETTSASGVSSTVSLTNTTALPAPFTVKCVLNVGSVAGTAGTLPANTAQRFSLAGGLGCPANGTLRGLELTFAVPEGSVIGSVVRQNVSTGQASFDNMVGNK